jgi:hypothetical protein
MKGCRESGWIVAIQSGKKRSIKRRKKVRADPWGEEGRAPQVPDTNGLEVSSTEGIFGGSPVEEIAWQHH